MVSIFKMSNSKTTKITTVEAFNIWNILRTRYISVETYQFFRNFVHDRDFYILLGNHLDDFVKQINILEKKGQQFNVKIPTKPPKKIEYSGELEIITDRYIYRKMYADLISELFSLLYAVRSATNHDQLRKTFSSFLMNHLNNYEDLYKFGKLKAWNEVEPGYKTDKPVKKEPLSVSEAHHVWEHLNYR